MKGGVKKICPICLDITLPLEGILPLCRIPIILHIFSGNLYAESGGVEVIYSSHRKVSNTSVLCNHQNFRPQGYKFF